MVFAKKCFHVGLLFHVIITNELPLTILQAYVSLPRHIRKGMLLKWILRQMTTEVGSQRFRKASKKRQGRIMFERIYSFFHHCLLSFRYVMFQKQYFE